MKSYLSLVVIALHFANNLQVFAKDNDTSLTGPSAILTTTSNENNRFSRLLHDNAASLQFSSISNLSPPLSGLPKEFKESKSKSLKKASLAAVSSTNLGRRTLDYDDSESFYDNEEPLPKIITQPQPGNEYVYIRQGGIQTDQQQAAAASVTSINRQPHSQRPPLTLLRESNGKTVNISPLFEEEGKGVQAPLFYRNMFNIGTPDHADDVVTSIVKTDEEETETTTYPADPKSSNEVQDKMIVNVVTSEPRFEVENTNNVTDTKKTTPIPTASTSKNITSNEDLKENLVVQSSRRIGSFPDFEDSPAGLQTAESSSQPARVNVRPAQNGKEYEYEYIYYYYDDDDENNGTAKNGTSAKGVKTTPLASTDDKIKTDAPSKTVNVAESDFDDEEYEDEIEAAVSPKAPVHILITRPTTTSPTTTTTTTTASPTVRRVPVQDKFNKGVVNEIESSRAPKSFTVEKVQTPEADYKIEAGDFETQYEYEDEQVQVKAKGQPQRTPSAEDDTEDNTRIIESSNNLSTAAPVPSSTAQDDMVTVQKTHPDSVNSPIVLKQSGLLQAVPASKLQPSNLESQPTSPVTTPITTTTTQESGSEPIPSVRPPSPRFRGQQRVRGDVKHETVKQSEPALDHSEPTTKSRPSFNRDNIRRTPSRRPTVESSQTAPESSDDSKPQDVPSRSTNLRTRFPSRSTTTTTSPPTTSTAESVPVSQVSVSQSVNESQDDVEKAKESYVRSKAAHDLFSFTRLQQAISSRAPARKNIGKSTLLPKLAHGSQNSLEQNTEVSSSEVGTTLTSISEIVRTDEQTSAATTTTSTTTTQKSTTGNALDKFGKSRNRFGTGRGRSSTVAPENIVASSTTEAAPRAPSRSRYNGRKRPSTATPTEGSSSDSTSNVAASEPEKPKVPTSNRFSTRTRSTTEAPVAEEKKENSRSEIEASPSPTSAAASARRKPIFQGRRRNPTVSSTAAPTQEDAPSSSSTSSDSSIVPASTSVSETQGPTEEKKRPGLPNVQRRRPLTGGPRLRGGRLGASSTTTTETPKESGAEQSDTERSPTQENEQIIEAAPSVASSQTSPLDPNNRGNTGVLGRLRTRPHKPVVTTTTAAPEPAIRERKPSRLNGILNRRKPGSIAPSSGSTIPSKEESHSESNAEEVHNTAQEQEDSQHKGVVVQVSSSVTESEEAHHGEEETEQASSTTPGSILNRLKSQRKPGSIFRKRADPHGE